MARIADGPPSVQPGRDEASPAAGETSQGEPEHKKAGLLRRRRDVSGPPSRMRACPACGLRVRDQVAAELGFCDRCRDFTGMCGAGRRIICPDVMTRTTWHSPCTELGAVAWDITQVQGRCLTLLCRVHDTQLRFGGTPWIVAAAPLNPADIQRQRQAATAQA